jgi:regulator of protease activity HflC (stomatin/prohibitin superfamily)
MNMYEEQDAKEKAALKKYAKWALLTVAVLAVALVSIFSWQSHIVAPGHVGVIVDNPYFFGDQGVRSDAVPEGRKFLWKTSYIVPVNIQPAKEDVTLDDFSTSDNYLMDFSSQIQFRIIDGPSLIKSFGVTWFKNVLYQPYVSAAREALKTRKMSQLMSDTKTAQEIDDKLTTALVAIVKEKKLPIIIENVSLGRAKPNASVLAELDKTATEQQRQLTLEAAEQSEIKREREQIAKARADNAYRNNMNLSPEQFVRLEEIRRYSEVCAVSKNCTVLSGQGQGIVLTK